MRVAMGIAALCLASPAAAEQWRASSQAGGATAYIDTDSIARSGDEVRFWREVRWPEPRAFDNGARYDRIGTFYLADCKAMTLRSLKLRVGLEGVEVFAADADEPAQRAEPGSTAEIDLRSACFDQWPAAG